jgi:hypothetical protein
MYPRAGAWIHRCPAFDGLPAPITPPSFLELRACPETHTVAVEITLRFKQKKPFPPVSRMRVAFSF